MKPFTALPRQRGLTLVEVLVVVVIVLVLLALFVARVSASLQQARANGMMRQGVGMYKAIFAQVLDDPEAIHPELLFPRQTNHFDSSTAYFRALVTNEVLRVDYSFFSGPGLDRFKTQDPAAFLASNNAWSVCLDVGNESYSTPFLFSRNFLATRTHMVSSNETLSVDMLGEPKGEKRLDFDRHAAVVITNSGTGFLTKRKEFKEGHSAARINPTPYRGPFLKP